jgi:hypothetical protein
MTTKKDLTKKHTYSIGHWEDYQIGPEIRRFRVVSNSKVEKKEIEKWLKKNKINKIAIIRYAGIKNVAIKNLEDYQIYPS